MSQDDENYDSPSNILSMLKSKVSATMLASIASLEVETAKSTPKMNPKKQKRNVYVRTEGMYAPAPTTLSGQESDSWICSSCGQLFRSEQVSGGCCCRGIVVSSSADLLTVPILPSLETGRAYSLLSSSLSASGCRTATQTAANE